MKHARIYMMTRPLAQAYITRTTPGEDHTFGFAQRGCSKWVVAHSYITQASPSDFGGGGGGVAEGLWQSSTETKAACRFFLAEWADFGPSSESQGLSPLPWPQS